MCSDLARAIAVGARSYGWWFVGGRWPRPPSLAMNPQFTLAEADELRARPLFVSIAVGAQTQPEPIAVGARSYRGGGIVCSWWFCRRPLAQATFSCDEAAIHLV